MTTNGTTSETKSRSLREMAVIMRKPSEPYWISGVFFRPWTGYLSALLAKMGFSPNVITAISGVFLAMGALFLAIENPLAWAFGGVLVLLYFTLDHCDGEVARFRAIVHGQSSGPAGIFWDGVAHGLTPLLVVGVGYRLTMEGSFGAWPMVLVAISVAAGGTAPWQRSCEAVLAWGHKHWCANNTIQVPASFVEDGVDDDEHSSSKLSAYQFVKQMVLFPGTLVTLPAAAFLDAIVGPIELTIGEDSSASIVNVYWVGLWLLQIAAGNTAAAINSSRRNSRKLQLLHSDASSHRTAE